MALINYTKPFLTIDGQMGLLDSQGLAGDLNKIKNRLISADY